MPIELGANRYGKSRVRLMKVTRGDGAHSVVEWNVEVWLRGDFHECFVDGDNSRILPTDTMKNTVYSLARASAAASPEAFAVELASHFIDNNPHADGAEIRIQSTPWKQLGVNDATLPYSFTHDANKIGTVVVTIGRESAPVITSGFEKLWLLKTANSGFAGFMKDRLTTLKETHDRLLGTLAEASWLYTGESLDFNALRRRIEAALLIAFAEHDSLSVQQTLYAMAEAALENVPEIAQIHLSMPNKHCNLVDLSPFGQDNPNEIFVPTDEPHGSIEATVFRQGVK
ncbi:urate oxidase [Silvibacterium bohemicum]|uniref:Uricase n=1 Tax=Silvibacterium bohemicum TaxID=1577686 RepID=A0A841JXR0_9BACT|nr:urate oxidase [Silvibacterium bohemicum]MBB6146136.1 urate oxidase [Silvibacterium bohemicum]